MSLDKFVMRGFTSSTGSSTGQWVAKSGSQPHQSSSSNLTATSKSQNSGSSFILGNSPSGRYLKQGSQSTSIDKFTPKSDYAFDASEVRTKGTELRRQTHSGCFGHEEKRGVGFLIGSPKVIMFLFLVLATLACVALSYSGKNRHRLRGDEGERPDFRQPFDYYGKAARPIWDKR